MFLSPKVGPDLSYRTQTETILVQTYPFFLHNNLVGIFDFVQNVSIRLICLEFKNRDLWDNKM